MYIAWNRDVNILQFPILAYKKRKKKKKKNIREVGF